MLYFKRNELVCENAEDEELLAKAKENKQTKMYSIYLYNILMEESNEDYPLTVKDLCIRLIQRYKTYATHKTVKSHLDLFQKLDNFELKGNGNDGFYLKPKSKSMDEPLVIYPDYRIDDYMIYFLVESVRTSRRIQTSEKQKTIENLALMCADELMRDYLCERTIPKQQIDQKKNLILTRLYEDIPTIIKEQTPIDIKVKHYSKPRRFYLSAVLPKGETPMLIGTFSLSGDARFILPSMIEDYKIVKDETFNKVKLNLHPSLFISGEDIKLLINENPNVFNPPTESEMQSYQKRIENARRVRNEI